MCNLYDTKTVTISHLKTLVRNEPARRRINMAEGQSSFHTEFMFLLSYCFQSMVFKIVPRIVYKEE